MWLRLVIGTSELLQKFFLFCWTATGVCPGNGWAPRVSWPDAWIMQESGVWNAEILDWSPWIVDRPIWSISSCDYVNFLGGWDLFGCLCGLVSSYSMGPTVLCPHHCSFSWSIHDFGVESFGLWGYNRIHLEGRLASYQQLYSDSIR